MNIFKPDNYMMVEPYEPHKPLTGLLFIKVGEEMRLVRKPWLFKDDQFYKFDYDAGVYVEVPRRETHFTYHRDLRKEMENNKEVKNK